MKKTFSPKKSAFSLIELSIVLIIIGLLIAGITGGASLIKSSELRSVVVEARVYGAAVNNFYSRYVALPGDYTVAVVASDVPGNGNNQIEFAAATRTDSSTATATAEGVEALRDLQSITAIDATTAFLTAQATAGSGDTTAIAVVGAMTPVTHFPGSKVKAAGWALDYNFTSSQNVVVLTGATSAGSGALAQTGAAITANTLVNGTTVSAGVVLPVDVLSIDAKVDDGIGNTGKLRGVNIGASTTDCQAATTGVYAVATTTKTCAISYQVDVNS